MALQPIDTEPEETSNFFQRNAGRGRGRTGRTTNAPNPLHSNLNASLKNPLKKGDWTEEEEKSKARLRVSVPVPATKPEEKDNRPWRHKDQNEDSQATHDEETPDVASSNPWKMSSAPKSDTPSPTLTVPSTTPLPVIINKSQGLPQTQEPQPIPTPQALSQSQPIPSPHLLEKELSPQEVMQRLQTLNDKWMYIDPSGQERGPFSSTQMEKWLSRNFFKSDLMLRREADQTFLPLARLFLQEQRNPFTLQPLYLWLQPPMTEFKSNLQRYLENQQQRQEQQRQLQQLLTTAKDLSSSQGLPVPQQQPPQSFPIRISSPSVPAPTPLFPNLPGMMPPNLSPQIPNIIPTVPPVSGPPGLTQPIIPGFPMAPLGMPMNSVGVFPPYWNQNPQFLQWQMMMMLQAQQQQTVPVPTAEVSGKENAAPTEHVAEVIEKGSEQIIEQPSTQLAQSALGRESVEEEVVVKEEQELPLKIDSPKPQEATKQQNQKQKPEPAQQAKPAQPQGQKQAAQATKQQPKKQNLVEAGKKQESPIQQQEALKVDTPQKKQDTQKLRNTPDPQAIPKPQQKQPQKQQNQPKQQNQKQNQKQAKQKDAPQPEPVEEPLEEGWFKAEKRRR
uniref:GYF domain-containing protein n=1 Tax=Arcella intermedia TaxID=1963864 RepID=A0A6B2KZS3_9EUKA